MTTALVYDRIGESYREGRREDARIAAAILAGLGDASPVLNVGAGAAMGVLTVHHWTDRARGLAEMCRVARGPVLLFIRDPRVVPSWWLHDYFPATKRLEARAYVRPQADPGRRARPQHRQAARRSGLR